MATATKAESRSGGAKKQRPVWTKKRFPLEVAVFEFPNENTAPNFSVKLTRSFRRDEESDWETTDYLGASDLLSGARLLEAAYEFIQGRLEADYERRKGETPEAGVDIPY